MFNHQNFVQIEAKAKDLYWNCQRVSGQGSDARALCATQVFNELQTEYPVEYIYKYLGNCSKRDFGAALFPALSRYPIEQLEIATDGEIYDAIQKDFWRIMAHPAAVRNLFGLTIYGAPDTLSKAVREYHVNLERDPNYESRMALYPDLNKDVETVRDVFLARRAKFLTEGRVSILAGSSVGTLEGEVSLLLGSAHLLESRQSNYQLLTKMLRTVGDLQGFNPVKLARAETIAEAGKRTLRVITQKLAQNYLRYEDCPELLTNSIAAINVALQFFAIGSRIEAFHYREVLEEIFNPDLLEKEEAIRVLTIGGFFSNARREASEIASIRRANGSYVEAVTVSEDDDDEDEAPVDRDRLMSYFPQ